MKHTALIMISALLLSLASCTKKIYIPLENVAVRTDTLRQSVVRSDTLYLHDSIVRTQKGDTLIQENWRWRYKTRTLHDTIYKTRRDTVARQVPVAMAASGREQGGGWKRLLIAFLAGIGCVMLIWGWKKSRNQQWRVEEKSRKKNWKNVGRKC